MLDAIVRGGVIVGEDGSAAVDLAIRGGKVVALLAPGEPATAQDEILADGKVVIPGLVDAHVHLREPGLVHKEGFATGTRAAAAGGVTTVMVMPTDKPLTLTPDQFAEKRALAEGQAHVDFALQAGLGSDTAHVAALVELGAISFETFLADAAAELLLADSENLLRVLSHAASLGAVVGITPGDHAIATSRMAQIRAASTGAWGDWPKARPPVAEAIGVARACLAARETGARIHLRQMSCAASVDVLRGLGRPPGLSSEVTPHNLVLDETELVKQGPKAKVGPPLRPAADLRALVRALQEDIVDIVATDHAPHLPAEKEAGMTNIWAAPGGLPGLQTFLPVMLGLVEAGAITMEHLVRTCAARPARLFGLYPGKGSLRVGADADLVIVDPEQSLTIRDEDQYSKARMTPFAGRTVKGRPIRAYLRGQEIMRDGRVVGEPGGRFVRPAR